MSGQTIGKKEKDFLASCAILPDPGASGTIVPVDNNMVCLLTSAAAETRSLASAAAYPLGFRLRLIMKVDGGDITITSTGLNATGNNTITFNDVSDWILLEVGYNASLVHTWRVIAYDGSALSTV